ncbi:MAG TPA: SBBP repeat-containing protein, partial [Nitrospiraceae bacterium]|nr:SBBP repeat-containing protein [Nitrospiraceae bacterium]
AIQSTFGGIEDAFVTKLNAAGTALIYSTYLGGSGVEEGHGIAVDAAGSAHVTGWTSTPGSGFPGTTGSSIQSTNGGGNDAFVTKLNATGTALVYSTYLGGSGIDLGYGITVDAAGSAYVTGWTSTPGSGFPGTAGSSIQSTYSGGGGSDAFVTKLNAAGTALGYSTYLGGSGGNDVGQGIAVDAAGNAYVTGWTFTPGSGFPGTAGSIIQSTYGGSGSATGFGGSGGDAFVAKITTNLPFAAFRANAEIDLRHRPHHDEFQARHRHHEDEFEGHHRPHHDKFEDEFEMTAIFTLGPNNNGIAPLTEAVTVQVGAFSTTIPAGSFKQKKGRFTFEGVIHGVKLEAVLRSLMLGNDYEFKVEGKGANLTVTSNPVTVGLTIGDDSGSKTIRAKLE